MPESQAEVIAFLSDPATHAGRPVQRFDTHASVVFLAGGDALKLKRAVRYPYLDFSTVEKRHAAALAELAANRAAAPQIYLGLLAVTRAPSGALQLGGDGPAIDWLVHMRRFDENSTFDALAARGELTADRIDRTADAIAALHAVAPVRREASASASAAELAAENAALLAAAPSGALDPVQVGELRRRTQAAVQSVAPLLDRRRADGTVRRGHGDLHLRNVCLADGVPTLFDALEFDERLATTDVLYDVAFLLMDLWHRGLRDLANRLLNRYLERTRDLDGLAALPLFLSLRAAIRAHVALAAGGQGVDAAGAVREARSYLGLAVELLASAPPMLVAIGGWSGTGKTTQARLLAPAIGRPPGAVILRSDVTRKRLLGAPELRRLGPEGYVAPVTERVYAELVRDAGRCLRGGQAVILDAVSARPAERAAFAAAAAALQVPFRGFWLEAGTAARVDRVDGRRGDASDADAALARRQESFDPGPIEWQRIDAAGEPTRIAAGIAARLKAEPKP